MLTLRAYQPVGLPRRFATQRVHVGVVVPLGGGGVAR